MSKSPISLDEILLPNFDVMPYFVTEHLKGRKCVARESPERFDPNFSIELTPYGKFWYDLNDWMLSGDCGGLGKVGLDLQRSHDSLLFSQGQILLRPSSHSWSGSWKCWSMLLWSLYPSCMPAITRRVSTECQCQSSLPTATNLVERVPLWQNDIQVQIASLNISLLLLH